MLWYCLSDVKLSKIIDSKPEQQQEKVVENTPTTGKQKKKEKRKLVVEEEEANETELHYKQVKGSWEKHIYYEMELNRTVLKDLKPAPNDM